MKWNELDLVGAWIIVITVCGVMHIGPKDAKCDDGVMYYRDTWGFVSAVKIDPATMQPQLCGAER